jgi:hypothetical protein
MFFSFGQSERERIEVNVLRYERAPVGDYYDDNWLKIEISVQAGGFEEKVNAAILTEDLERFLSQLRPLYETLSGSAEFGTMEDQLNLKLAGDGKGHIELHGEVADRPGIGNRLHFTLQFDQSQLRASIGELEKATLQFPVRGLNSSAKKN